MARIIEQDSPTKVITPLYPLGYMIGTGATLGVLFWGLSAWMNYYVVDQILCRSSSTLSACLNATSLSGNISAVIIAIIGTALLVRLRVMQPLIVAIAAATTLWGLSSWTVGLSSLETLVWSVVLYGMVYVLFSWITRYKRIAPVLLVTTMIIIAVRLFA